MGKHNVIFTFSFFCKQERTGTTARSKAAGPHRGPRERQQKEAEQAAALQAVLELCLMSYSECNIKNMTDKTVDETAWRDEIKMWNCKEEEL